MISSLVRALISVLLNPLVLFRRVSRRGDPEDELVGLSACQTASNPFSSAYFA